MSYKLRKETIERQNHLKEIPEEELNKMREILNEYIAKNRKKHLFILKKSIARRIGSYVTDEIAEDILQEQYIYAWTNIERVMEFYDTGYLDRYFNTLFFHVATRRRAEIRLGRDVHTEFIDDILPEEESPQQYTNDALNAKLPLQERLEAHRIALDETKEFLWDNPNTNLKKALDLTRERHGQSTYLVALNYIATPSYSFLMKNCRELGIKNVQWNIDRFKKICSEVYGKEILKQAEMPWILY